MKEKISKAVENDLQKLLNEFVIPPLGDGEFTVTTVQEARGITKNVAYGLIAKMVRAKKIEFLGLRLCNGHKCKAYRVKGKP